GLRGKSVFMSLLLFTMIFNGGMIPNFLLIRGLGMYDTLWAQIIPAILSAYNTILMINFFKALPPSLFEAAKVDGASEPFILFKIVFPLSKAIIATIALFAAVGYWNNYFSGVLYARSQENWPLQLVLREIIMSANTAIINTDGNMAEMDLNSISSESLRYATLVVVMVPIMCIYPFLQKYFAKGVMLGAVKE
ncbi:MAG: carbohydrate ABC transporter permease, partial [Clostridiales bacterium]|nr:carbohydrate ABC transporter permease [Clostridiales bacterium]